MYKIGYTTGVFDMFHIGHLNILERSKAQCEHLIVGVSTDKLVKEYKNKTPIIPEDQRKRIVSAIKFVDEVVYQESMDKFAAWEKYKFDVVFVGSDWKGTEKWNKIEAEFKKLGVDVVYLPHTDGISSTILAKTVGE